MDAGNLQTGNATASNGLANSTVLFQNASSSSVVVGGIATGAASSANGDAISWVKGSNVDANISIYGGIQAGDASGQMALSSVDLSAGAGSVDRKEKIELQIAAIIVDQLPNGNFVIAGKQEVRVNFELRELLVQGIIRPQDVSPTNAIAYNQIAEARISYGGRGQITDVQQPRYGQQVFDMIWPY